MNEVTGLTAIWIACDEATEILSLGCVPIAEVYKDSAGWWCKVGFKQVAYHSGPFRDKFGARISVVNFLRKSK